MADSTNLPVDFYFDPSCPWTWVSSRWLDEAAAQRRLDVRWRPISLLLKNGDDTPAEKREQSELGLAAARIAVAVERAGGNADLAAFYAAFGASNFGDDRAADLSAALAKAGIDARLAAAASDQSLDAVLESHAVDAEKMAGPDAGSPVLAIEELGRGAFGPVLSEVPAGPAAGALWDHVVALLGMPEFYELTMERRSPPH
jgi:2-hydroxychromene-2-carboxylate isomerase